MNLVEFDDVSKCYRLGERTNAREALMAAIRRPFGGRPSRSEIWSLRDVSFSVAEGQSLGIVGRNGAGKSTVLKILAGITSPTGGVSRTRGRVAPLLEVGTGFHPELTGRENVFLNGAVLGMSRRDIARRFDEIVDFSGVQRFLDTPVKRYSSGMYLRLAFAVAAHLEPDILVVDEILAVGDAEFQRKCIGRMHAAEQEGRTLVFVSHDLDSLARLCPEAIWLDGGRVRQSGPTQSIVRDYLADGVRREDTARTLAAGPVTVHRVSVSAERSHPSGTLMRHDPLSIDIELSLTDELPGLDLAIYLANARSVRILDQTLSDTVSSRLRPGRYVCRMSLPAILNVGEFTVGIWIGTAHDELIDEPSAASFTLHGHDQGRPDRVITSTMPLVMEQIQVTTPGQPGSDLSS